MGNHSSREKAKSSAAHISEEEDKKSSMAFGVVALEEDGNIISGKTQGYASSTKVRLVGLLAAVLA